MINPTREVHVQLGPEGSSVEFTGEMWSRRHIDSVYRAMLHHYPIYLTTRRKELDNERRASEGDASEGSGENSREGSAEGNPTGEEGSTIQPETESGGGEGSTDEGTVHSDPRSDGRVGASGYVKAKREGKGRKGNS